MKKKNEVYVVVDTPKKAKKLKKVLDMFGEKVYENVVHYNDGHPYYAFEEMYFVGHYTDKLDLKDAGKTEVSIKDLKNILAFEHLKEGDVVVCKDGDEIALGVFKEWDNQFGFDLDNCYYLNDPKYISLSGGGCFDNFIRYATEEEKALLEPKKELEVGKWYKSKDFPRFLSIHLNNNRYGFDISGDWFDNVSSKLSGHEYYYEATPQEVEQALIEEAKRRGFVNGGVGNNSNIHDTTLEDCELFFNNEYELDNKDNSLRLILDADTTWTVFKDGQWANIIEQDKFAELKEAHSKGAEIQINNIYGGWADVVCKSDLWLENYEYRIKPQPTFTDKDVAIIERLHDTLLDNHKYDLQSDVLTEARMLADKIKSNIK